MIKQTAGFSISPGTVDCVLPPAQDRTWDWVRTNGRTPDGKPFNWLDYPWTEGICDAWDDPRRDTIWLMFAARLGKTLIAHTLLCAAIARRPAPALYGATTETFVKQTINKKIYPMLEWCDETRGSLPPKHKRLQTRVDLLHSTLYTAWSGSPTTLADLDPHYKHAGEIDKWNKASSDEADPLQLFLERGREVPDRKTIAESTPTIEGHSRVAKGVKRGTNCRWQVPCPSCGGYQELTHPEYDDRDGWQFSDSCLIFDCDESGQSSLDRAYATARYRCGFCKHEIYDVDRKPMVRRGVWVPSGQYVDRKGKIAGKAHSDGPEASFQLARIYAPTFTFGDIGRGLVESLEDEKARQNFANSWMGIPYRRRLKTEEWTDVAKRLVDERYRLRTVPSDALFLTAGIDVQATHFVFVVVAWSRQTQGHVVDYGDAEDWQELAELVGTDYDDYPVRMTLVDARDGNRTQEVVESCLQMNSTQRRVWPSMGTGSALMAGKSYSLKDVKDRTNARRKSRRDFWLVSVNTGYWQTWIHHALFHRERGAAGSLVMPQESREDQDWWEQLLNETPDDRTNATGHNTTQYCVVNESIPWDFRDAVRYARCAAEVYTRGNWNRARVQKSVSQQHVAPDKPQKKNKFLHGKPLRARK